ncbi:hypothetical protein AVEN_165267-1 [Araneus ventricosus]|uniref:Uncharacterized protein n=1 Tax=Araneus ventricosus TaxID=182803 RepID=A0A4Y2ASR7_ARAVE|nr:hypothetical protein AVEN_165267-1 [Araneus ventricosus]
MDVLAKSAQSFIWFTPLLIFLTRWRYSFCFFSHLVWDDVKEKNRFDSEQAYTRVTSQRKEENDHEFSPIEAQHFSYSAQSSTDFCRGCLVVRPQLRDLRVPDSKPDSTEDTSCVGPVAR